MPADRLAEYRVTFPHLDTEAELRKARLWLNNNPTKSKTAKGMPRFLTGWLGRARSTAPGQADHRTPTALLDMLCPLVEPTNADLGLE